MEKEIKKDKARLVIELPRQEIWEFKKRALDQNLTLRNWVLKAIFNQIEQEKKHE